MAKNNLGVGFAYGGKDAGLSKATESATSQFGMLGKAVKSLNELVSINRLQLFIDALSLSRLGDVKDKIEQIGVGGLQLTTSLEGTFQANAREAKSFGVTIGKTGEELKQFTAQSNSMAYSLGIGAQEASGAIYGFEAGQQTLAAVGIKSATDFAKFAEVTGVNTQNLGWDIKNMTTQLGLSADQMALVIGQATAYGKTTGTLSETLGSVGDMTDILQQRVAGLGASTDQITQFAQQTYALGDAMYKVGIKDGKGFAVNLAKHLTDAGDDFGKLFSGVGDDLNSFITESAIAIGPEMIEAFSDASMGPADFLKNLATTMDAAEQQLGPQGAGQALKFFRDRVGQVFGPDTDKVVSALMDKTKRASLINLKTVTNASEAMGQVVKDGFTSKFTLAERFERSSERLVYRFRKVSRKDTERFVKDSEVAFNRFGNVMEKVAAEKGPLGMFIRKLSLAHQIGAQAFIPEALRPMVALFGEMAKEAGPLLGILGSLGFRFSMLLSPIALVIAAVVLLGGWFVKLRLEGQSTGEALGTMGLAVQKFFTGLPKMVEKGVEAISSFFDNFETSGTAAPWMQIWKGVFIAAGEALFKIAGILAPFITKMLKKAFEWVVKTAWPWLSSVIPPLLKQIGEAIKQHAPLVVKGALVMLEWVAKALYDGLPVVLKGMVGIVKAGLGMVRDIVLGIWEGVRLYFIEKFPESADTINNVFLTVADTVTGVFGFLTSALDMAVEGWSMLLDFFNDDTTSIANVFSELWSGIKLMVWEVVSDIKFWFINLWEEIKVPAIALFHDLETEVTDSVAAMGQVLESAVDTFIAPFKAIDGWVDKLFRNSISSDMKEDFDVATGYASKFSKDMSKSLTMAGAPMNGITGKVTVSPGGGGVQTLPPALKPVPATDQGIRDSSLVNAINSPRWYMRYEQVFTQRMQALEAALMKNNSPKGGRPSNPVGKRPGGLRDDQGLNRFTATDNSGMPTSEED